MSTFIFIIIAFLSISVGFLIGSWWAGNSYQNDFYDLSELKHVCKKLIEKVESSEDIEMSDISYYKEVLRK